MPDVTTGAWPFITALCVIVGAGASVVLVVQGVRWRREKRLFTWEVVSQTEALSSTDLHGPQLTLHADGTPLRFGGLMVADVRLTNAGSRAVRKEDYGEPLTLEMGQGARVLVARVMATAPDRFTVPLTIQDGGRVQLPPVPLNSGASYTVHIVAFNAFGVEVHGIIPDVPKKEIRAQERRSMLGFMVALLTVTLTAIALTLIAALLFPASVGHAALYMNAVIMFEYWALLIYIWRKTD